MTMKWVIPVAELTKDDQIRVGGKAYMLYRLHNGGFSVPKTLFIPTDAYMDYVDRTGLRERIQAELRRKALSEMRWEEMWDCALRIRHMFSKKPLPDEMAKVIGDAMAAAFGEQPVAIRSSALEEDSAAHSFAGIHDSYINVKGCAQILSHLRRVWASLWSDAAILYRREIGLDVQASAMAVVIQEVIEGECSGIVFTKSPTRGNQGVLEAVHGMNQALVDGAVEPDRWIFDRKTRKFLAHTPAKRDQWMQLADTGVELVELPLDKSASAPLDPETAEAIFLNAFSIEAFFKSPQDIEWTMDHHRLVFLQARPITTLSEKGAGDDRSWYMGLRRTYDNLKTLRSKIETELVPAMEEAADELGGINLADLTDRGLAEEIHRRKKIYDQWKAVYWSDFIPFAHGMRLFGETYNDIIQPDDPYEFVDILSAGELMSLDRNRYLEKLALMVREDPLLAASLKQEDPASFPPEFADALALFNNQFGDLSCGMTDMSGCRPDPTMIYRLLLNMAGQKAAKRISKKTDVTLEERVMEYARRFPASGTIDAFDLLELARASYRMRDDDNIYLGRIEAQLFAAVNEGSRRLADAACQDGEADESLREAVNALVPQADGPKHSSASGRQVRPRQLRGQPAGPGFFSGTARVVSVVSDLENFKQGDILVCDAVEPNMTFVVPLAGAIVERRGGMLIHGAIIAREYGLPCVTGIADAAEVIRTGDLISVDGYLGVVTILSAE